jgi:hypothetical protein
MSSYSTLPIIIHRYLFICSIFDIPGFSLPAPYLGYSYGIAAVWILRVRPGYLYFSQGVDRAQLYFSHKIGLGVNALKHACG